MYRDKGTPDVCLLLYGNDESDSDYKYGPSADQGDGQLAATGRVYSSPDDAASLSGFGHVYLMDTGADKDDDMDDSGRIQGFSAFEKRKFVPMLADQPTASDSEIGADQQLTRRLSEILSSAQETLPLYDDGPIVVDEDDGDEEDDIDLSLSSNLYSNPKFERQERLDVKKPGPWFSVNNYAFDDSAENSAAAAAADQVVGSIWRRSGNPTLSEDDYFFDAVEDVPTSRDFRKNNMAVPNAEELRHLAVEQLLQRLSIEQEIQQDLEEADIKQVDQLKVADVKPTAAPATQLKVKTAIVERGKSFDRFSLIRFVMKKSRATRPRITEPRRICAAPTLKLQMCRCCLPKTTSIKWSKPTTRSSPSKESKWPINYFGRLCRSQSQLTDQIDPTKLQTNKETNKTLSHSMALTRVAYVANHGYRLRSAALRHTRLLTNT